MGKPFGGPEWMENPNARGGPGTGGYEGLEDWAKNVGLGMAGKSAKSVLKQMNAGNYEGLAGDLLAPIHDRFATNLREGERNALMGANAMYAGSQPALMAGLQDTLRRNMAEAEGMALGQAIPSLWSTAGGMFQNARNSRLEAELGALTNATKARLGSGDFVNKPGWVDRVGQVAGTAGQLFGLASGIPALGFGGGGGSGMEGGSYFSNPGSDFYVPPGMPGNNMGIPGYDPGNYVPPLAGR